MDEESEDLNTYVDSICFTASPARFRGRRIDPSHAALIELMKEGKTLHYVADVLELGYDAPRKRKRGTVEKWLDRGKKTYNAVIAESYREQTKEQIWVLIHFGKFTRRK